MKNEMGKIRIKIKQLYNYLQGRHFPRLKNNFNSMKLEDKVLDIRIDLIEWDAWVVGYTDTLIKYKEVKWDNDQLLSDVKRIDKLFDEVKIPTLEKIGNIFFDSLIERKEKIKELVNLLIQYKNELEKSKLKEDKS